MKRQLEVENNRYWRKMMRFFSFLVSMCFIIPKQIITKLNSISELLEFTGNMIASGYCAFSGDGCLLCVQYSICHNTRALLCQCRGKGKGRGLLILKEPSEKTLLQFEDKHVKIKCNITLCLLKFQIKVVAR